ncbi:CorA family divalent cation transporter [Desulfosarcina sp.]|uniref:CorA family divalent cation transporter n=1 Tax=Desulfosarcina sp. TaxID=2027861 RepID=UPI0029B0AE71|nr:CorA family divalent cation transporter [Desulfosarcina sp.]MDX2451485.1 CorA family divalent cation transporter [Desulfosarcina sp.]MDX2489301.1 CorA family divalent cation transporter [Desulfosarcina sp.]
MSRFTRKSSKKAGSSPGTLVHVGEKKTDDIRLAMLHYDADTLMERPLNRVEEALPLLTTTTTTWINIDGIHDISVMEHIGRHFGLHPLTLEDVLNTTQRPKAEAFDDYLFVVMKMLHHGEKDDLIYSEQISLILGKNVLISFQESAGDVFEPVRERIRKGQRTDPYRWL